MLVAMRIQVRYDGKESLCACPPRRGEERNSLSYLTLARGKRKSGREARLSIWVNKTAVLSHGHVFSACLAFGNGQAVLLHAFQVQFNCLSHQV